mgnify:CR=1 FL=1
MNILASTPPSLTSHLGLTIFIAVAAVGTAAVIGAGMTLDSRPAVKVAVIGTCVLVALAAVIVLSIVLYDASWIDYRRSLP